jgi:hypothetical protein
VDVAAAHTQQVTTGLNSLPAACYEMQHKCTHNSSSSSSSSSALGPTG